MTPAAPLDRLFPHGHAVAQDGALFTGTGQAGTRTLAVIGTAAATAIGVEIAFRMAAAVLAVVRDHPGRPILLLVDTVGQAMSRRDETLGLNRYVAHLARSIDLARRSGHRSIGLVHGEAVSAGFLASSLLADACYALPDAEVRVMNLPAMARITKLPLERLEALSATSPVFAPGAANYVAMGAIRGIWDGDLAQHLGAALDDPADPAADRRRLDGEARGGRTLARAVAERVRCDAA